MTQSKLWEHPPTHGMAKGAALCRGAGVPYRERLFLSAHKTAPPQKERRAKRARGACASRPFCSSFLLGWGGFVSREKKSLPVRDPRTPAKGRALCHPMCGRMFPKFALCHDSVGGAGNARANDFYFT